MQTATNWFLSFGNSNGRKFFLFTSNTCLKVGSNDNAANVRDGNWHFIRFRWNTAYGYGYWALFVDGVKVEGQDGTNDPLYSNDTGIFVVNFANLAPGDVIDEIELSNDGRDTTIPSAAATRTDTTIVDWHLDGSGAGS